MAADATRGRPSRGFHVENGLYFDRMPDGFVKVYLDIGRPEADAGDPQTVACMSPDSWASVVAAMSGRGDDAATHEMALKLHFDYYPKEHKTP